MRDLRAIEVYVPGDESVGIQPYWLELTAQDIGTTSKENEIILDFDLLDRGEVSETVEEFREDLRVAFEKHLDGPVSITFDIDPKTD